MIICKYLYYYKLPWKSDIGGGCYTICLGLVSQLIHWRTSLQRRRGMRNRGRLVYVIGKLIMMGTQGTCLKEIREFSHGDESADCGVFNPIKPGLF